MSFSITPITNLFTRLSVNTVTVFNKAKSIVTQNLPMIGMVGGAISVGVGVFFACKATLHASEILDAHRESLAIIHQAVASGNASYTEALQRRDIFVAYMATAGRFARLYAPAFGFLAGGLISMFSGFGVLRGRYGYAVAAVSSLDEKYRKYRGKVVETYGEETDKILAGEIVESQYSLPEHVSTNSELIGTAKDVETKSEEVVEAVCIDPEELIDANSFTYVFSRKTSSKCEGFSYNTDLNFLLEQQHIMTLLLQSGAVDEFFLYNIEERLGLEKKAIGPFYAITNRKPGTYVDLNITPFYTVMSGEDDEQFPMILTVSKRRVYNNDTQRYDWVYDEYELGEFKKAYIDDATHRGDVGNDGGNVGFLVTPNVDKDENGIPQEYFTERFGLPKAVA